jgi:hypothetical protein
MAKAYLSMEVSESTNITNNTSSVTITLCYYGNGVSWNAQGAPGTVTIGGTTYNFRATFTKSTERQPLYTTPATTVAHNADGTGSVSCSAAFYTDTHDAGNLYTSRTVTLTTIPRATQPTVRPTSVVLGNPVVISMPRASTSFLHGLTYKIGNLSGDLGTGLGESITWSPPLMLAPAITGNSGTITFTCTTYSGGTAIGSKTVDLNVTLPTSVPTVDPNEIIIGQSTTIKTNRISNVLTHTIRYSVGSDTGIIATNVTDMINWQPPMSLVKNISGSIGDISVICDTYNGTTLVGSSTVILRLVVDVQSTINSLLQFTKLTSTVDFKVERSSSFKGRIPLDSTNTQDAFEELNEKIVPGGRVFEQLSSVPLSLFPFAEGNYEMTYNNAKTYGFFVNTESNLVVACNMQTYTAQAFAFGSYTPIMNSFSWGQDNSIWGVAQRGNSYYVVKINVDGGIFTYYALPNSFANCYAFSASEESNRLCVSVGNILYIYSDIALTGGNVANISNWTKITEEPSTTRFNNLWAVENKFCGVTNTGWLYIINEDNSVSSTRYRYTNQYYSLNNVFTVGVINNDKVAVLFDGGIKYSTDFFTSNTPTFTSVTVSGLDSSVARIIYSESDSKWYLYGINTTGNTKVYSIPSTISGSSVTATTVNLDYSDLDAPNIGSGDILCSIGADSEIILANGNVVSLGTSGKLTLKGVIGVTSGYIWKKIIKCDNRYVGLAQYFNESTNQGTSFITYSNNGLNWYGGYSFDGVFDDILFGNCSLFMSGYTNDGQSIVMSTGTHSTGKNNNNIDASDFNGQLIGHMDTLSGISTRLAYDGSNVLCTVANRSSNASYIAYVGDNVTAVPSDGYISHSVAIAPDTFYFLVSNNRIATLFRCTFSTQEIASEHEFILNHDSVAITTNYDPNEGTFYIILNNVVYDYRYLDVIIGNSQYSTFAMVYVDGHYLYNAPTPTYSSSAFSSGYAIKGILNGEIATNITDCDSFIYLITPSGKGYYSKTIK